MKYHFLKCVFLFCSLFCFLISGIAQTADTIALIRHTDGVSVWHDLEKGSTSYLVEKDGNVWKSRVKKKIKDFPELRKIVQFNFYEDVEFMYVVINCYNDYMKANPKPVPDTDYFRKHQIISGKESKKGPTEEMLKVKQPIYGSLRMTSTTTTHTDAMNPQNNRSTYGEKVRAHFTYGNSGFYNSGFMMKNLRRVMQDDPEAIKHLNKYRNNLITKRVVTVISLGLVGLGAACAFADKPPFGLTDGATPFLAGPGVLLFFGKNFVGSDRLEHVENAINTYNANLEKNKGK